MRKCIATGEMKPKKDMIRIVRSTEGTIFVDPTGKKNGRGAYMTLTEEAIVKAKKRKSLQSQFGTVIDEAVYEELMRLAMRADHDVR